MALASILLLSQFIGWARIDIWVSAGNHNSYLKSGTEWKLYSCLLSQEKHQIHCLRYLNVGIMAAKGETFHVLLYVLLIGIWHSRQMTIDTYFFLLFRSEQSLWYQQWWLFSSVPHQSRGERIHLRVSRWLPDRSASRQNTLHAHVLQHAVPVWQ